MESAVPSLCTGSYINTQHTAFTSLYCKSELFPTVQKPFITHTEMLNETKKQNEDDDLPVGPPPIKKLMKPKVQFNI